MRCAGRDSAGKLKRKLTPVNFRRTGKRACRPAGTTLLSLFKAMTAKLEVEQEKDGRWVATIPAGQDTQRPFSSGS